MCRQELTGLPIIMWPYIIRMIMYLAHLSVLYRLLTENEKGAEKQKLVRALLGGK